MFPKKTRLNKIGKKEFILQYYFTEEEDDFSECLKEENRMIVVNNNIIEIEKMTGGVLRKLKELGEFLKRKMPSTSVTVVVKNYQALQLDRYLKDIQKVVNKLTEKERESFYGTLLKVFNLKAHGCAYSIHEEIYDMGLFYKVDFDPKLLIINETAKRAFIPTLNKMEIRFVSSSMDSIAQGLLLEDRHIKTELSSTICHTFHYTTRKVGVEPVTLKYQIVQSIHFNKKLRFEQGHQEFVSTLFEPTDTKYPYVDYIIFDPNKKLIIFKQITVREVIAHLGRTVVSNEGKDVYVDEIVKFFFYKSYYWDQENSLKSFSVDKKISLERHDKELNVPREPRSQAVALLEFIFGQKGFTIQLCQGGKIVNVSNLDLFTKQQKQITYTYEDKVKLQVLKPDGSLLQNVFYLYGSGVTTNENDGIRDYFIENIGFYGKETCEETFHIPFSE